MLKASVAIYCTLFILFISPAIANDYQSQEVISWEERTNFLGSPVGYYFIPRDGKVRVYSNSGSEVFAMKIKGNERIFASPMGNYWGSAVFIDASADQLGMREFSLYNPSGQKLYTIKNPGVLRFVLNDNSPSVVGIEGTEGLPETNLRFFDESGQLSGERKITSYLLGRYAPDGSSYFAYSADSGLIVLDKSGNELYRLNSGRRFGAGMDGRLVLAADNGTLNLYYQNNLTNSIKTDLPGIREIILSDDNKTALVLSENSITCYSIPDLAVVWNYQLQNSSEHISACQPGPEAGLIAVGVAIDLGPDYPFTSRYNTGRVDFLNLQGEKQGSAELSYERWSRGFPKVFFSIDGHLLWILSDSNLQKIPIE